MSFWLFLNTFQTKRSFPFFTCVCVVSQLSSEIGRADALPFFLAFKEKVPMRGVVPSNLRATEAVHFQTGRINPISRRSSHPRKTAKSQKTS
jgi:hypothetical protein